MVGSRFENHANKEAWLVQTYRFFKAYMRIENRTALLSKAEMHLVAKMIKI